MRALSSSAKTYGSSSAKTYESSSAKTYESSLAKTYEPLTTLDTIRQSLLSLRTELGMHNQSSFDRHRPIDAVLRTPPKTSLRDDNGYASPSSRALRDDNGYASPSSRALRPSSPSFASPSRSPVGAAMSSTSTAMGSPSRSRFGFESQDRPSRSNVGSQYAYETGAYSVGRSRHSTLSPTRTNLFGSAPEARTRSMSPAQFRDYSPRHT